VVLEMFLAWKTSGKEAVFSRADPFIIYYSKVMQAINYPRG